jgi:NAD+ synthase
MIDLRFSPAELDHQHDHITQFISDQVAAAGVEGVVMGLSGGIDSTLTSHLAVDALGPDRVHGLVMPGEVSDADNMSDAERVAADLGIAYDVIEIEPVLESILEAYPDARGETVAVGNTRARIRAVFNYLVANADTRLVLGTGNRSEAAVGYFTKYGDGAVDCHPIGNLYKCQVRQLARHLGVAADLTDKTPTAGLWSNQTDEAELGIDYDTLDAILATHIDGPLSVAATCRLLDVDADTVAHVRSMVETSAHKRHAPPSPAPLDAA